MLYQRSPRDGDYLKKFFGDALKEGYSKPTGDQNLPWHIRAAREIKWEIVAEISARSIDGGGASNHWLCDDTITDSAQTGGSLNWPPNMDLEESVSGMRYYSI